MKKIKRKLKKISVSLIMLSIFLITLIVFVFNSVNATTVSLLPNTTLSKAYYSVEDDCSTSPTPASATTEFSDANYNATNVSDNNRYVQQASASKFGHRCTYQRYAFNVTAVNTTGAITSIKYCIEGYYTYSSSGGSAPTWFKNTTTWVSNVSLNYNSDTTICLNFSSNVNNYIQSDGTFQIGVSTDAMGGGTPEIVNSYVDFVNVTVVYVEAPATPPPTYSLNSTNSTLKGTYIEHRLRWNDNVNMSGYIFSFWNGSGSYRTPVSVYDKCGEASPAFANRSIDGNTATDWQEGGGAHEHWITYDLNVSANITKIRIYSDNPAVDTDPCSINAIYVSDDPNNMGSTLGNCTLSGSGTTWRECNLTTSNSGRYIKITFYVYDILSSTCTDAAFMSGFYEFQAYTSFVNDIWVQFPGVPTTQSWSNVTKGVNSTAGSNIQWCVYANDTSNNWNGTSCQNPFSYTTVEADTTPPIVTIQSPSNTTYTSTSVWANVTLNETGSWCGRSLDGAANVSMSNTTGNWNSQMTSLSNGGHNVRFYCNDSAGNMNGSTSNWVWFTVSTNLNCSTTESSGLCPNTTSMCTANPGETCNYPTCNCVVDMTQNITANIKYNFNSIWIKPGITINVNTNASGGAGGSGPAGTGDSGSNGFWTYGGSGGGAFASDGAGYGGNNSGGGGGGGSGDRVTSDGGDGGTGGGYVIFNASSFINISGSINTNGNNGYIGDSCVAPGIAAADGGGGGGGGGVSLISITVNISGSINATGGDGGDGGACGRPNSFGGNAGDGGGGGFINISSTFYYQTGSINVNNGTGGTGGSGIESDGVDGSPGSIGIFAYLITTPITPTNMSSVSSTTQQLNFTVNSSVNSTFPVTVFMNGTLKCTLLSYSNGTLQNCTVTGLTNGATYFWFVNSSTVYVNTNSSLWQFSVSAEVTTTTTTSITTTTISNIQIKGLTLYYYTGERVNGNVTVIPVEYPNDKETSTISNGEWSVNLYTDITNLQNINVIVDDNQKIGYNEIKLDTTTNSKLNCSVQNVSLSGYTVDLDSGNAITSGNIRISALDTDYTNTTIFTGTWSIIFHPCLIPGKIYVLQVLVSDNTGKKGEYLQKYPAR